MSNPIIEFAEAHYELGTEAAISGRFKSENSPWLIEPCAALCDPRIRETTLQLGAQKGKNLAAEIFIAYIVANMSGNVLVYCQTDEDAHDFAEDRVLKRVRPMSALKHLWPDTPAAKRKDEATLAHMYIKFLGANDSNTQGKSARFVLCDELHLWKKGMHDQARDRCSAFWDAKILNTSTAGDEGSEQDLAYKAGSQEEFHGCCPECGSLIKGRWAEKPRVLIWETNDITKPQGKAWNYQEVRKTIRIKCPAEGCNFESGDNFPTRVEIAKNGRYIAGNESAPSDKRSFTSSQIWAPWVSYEEIVERWLKAIERQKTGDLSLLKNFVIKRLAQTWENRIPGGTQAVVTGKYSLDDPFNWEDESHRFLTADVQGRDGRHFWWTVRAWSLLGESRLVSAGRSNTWAEIERAREQYSVLPQRVGVDSRYATKEVREACATYGWSWLMADETIREYTHSAVMNGQIVSFKRPFKPPENIDVFAGTKKQGTLFARGFHYSKNWAREALYNRIMGRGTAWDLPIDVDRLTFEGTNKKTTDYLSQINSWTPYTYEDKRTGEKKEDWKQIYADDHFRACEEMNQVMGALVGIVPSDL